MTRFSMYSGERITSDRLSVDFDTMAGVYQPPDYVENGGEYHRPSEPQSPVDAAAAAAANNNGTIGNNHPQNNGEMPELTNGNHRHACNKKQQQRKVQPKQMRHLKGNGMIAVGAIAVDRRTILSSTFFAVLFGRSGLSTWKYQFPYNH